MSGPSSIKVADAYLGRQQYGQDFVRAVSTALSIWDQKNPLKDGMTVADVMRRGAAELAWDTLATKAPAGWNAYTDEPRKLVQFLTRALRRPYMEALRGDSRAVLR